jgi:hypothetical protein
VDHKVEEVTDVLKNVKIISKRFATVSDFGHSGRMGYTAFSTFANLA